MCCLFGMIDYKQNFSGREKSRMLSILATACEARGTDATGIAYNAENRLKVYKRPLPAHKMRLRIPDDAFVVMGHTRMATQGPAKFSKNNHPFPGRTGGESFALAHNGVLYNDHLLRCTERLPATTIETDSYIAVQLLEQQGALSFDSLRYMAEKVEGSFSFTVLDVENDLYFVKGDSPLCIYHDPATGLYLYASTEEILGKALCRMKRPLEQPRKITVECGDILRITRNGEQVWGQFSAEQFTNRWGWRGLWEVVPQGKDVRLWQPSAAQEEYLRELKSIAVFSGYDAGFVDAMLEDGFSTDDVEEMLCYGWR